MASIDSMASSAFTVTNRGLGRASGSFQVFLGFQLFEECFEQPSMTGRHDKAVLAHLVDALDKISDRRSWTSWGLLLPRSSWSGVTEPPLFIRASMWCSVEAGDFGWADCGLRRKAMRSYLVSCKIEATLKQRLYKVVISMMAFSLCWWPVSSVMARPWVAAWAKALRLPRGASR